MKLGHYNVKRILVARLDDGEKLVEGIRKIALKEKISGGIIFSVVGAVADVEMINPGSNSKKPKPLKTAVRKKPMEILGSGNISRDEKGETHVHIHFTSAPKKGRVFMGHLVEACVKYFCEVCIGVLNKGLRKKYDFGLDFKMLEP